MKRVLTLCVLLAESFLTAQDSRAVTEPAIPQPCVSLEAKLTMSGDHLNVADESKLDTARIQQAIDECASGHAVVLKVREQATAFLSFTTGCDSGRRSRGNALGLAQSDRL
jgi:polygalacturonase